MKESFNKDDYYHHYIYDIEVFPNLFMVTVKSIQTGNYRVWKITEENKEDFMELVKFFLVGKKVLIGYNNFHYDDPIVYFLINEYRRLAHLEPKEITKELYEESGKCISNNHTYKYSKTSCFKSLDLMNIIRIGYNVKGLKMVAMNIMWPNIIDLPHSPHTPIPEDEISVIEEYNKNDVDITEAIYNKLLPDIDMRKKVSDMYNIDAISASESEMGLKLFEKLYSQKAGVTIWSLKYMTGAGGDLLLLGDVISDLIQFESPHMVAFLKKLKETSIDKSTVFSENITIGNTTYVMAKGGLHSENNNEVLDSKDLGYVIDADVTSYYPFTIINQEAVPRHLDKEAFLETLTEIIEDRVRAKKEKDEVRSYGLKIGANAIYGRFGMEGHWLFDLYALYKTTVNGQLFLLMLIEKLELNGIEVRYANTDGITAICRDDAQKELYFSICDEWQEATGYNLEFSFFDRFYIRNVNNFIAIETSGKVKTKGIFDPERYNNFSKSLYMPIVPLAVYERLVNNIPLEDTILNNKNIHFFCLSEKMGSTYSRMLFFEMKEGDIATIGVMKEIQNTNRYIVTKQGGRLIKQKKDGSMTSPSGIANKAITLVNNIYDDIDESVEIDYGYYLNQAELLIEPFLSPQLDLFNSK